MVSTDWPTGDASLLPEACNSVVHSLSLFRAADRKSLQKWDSLRFVTVFVRTTFLVLRHETIGVNNRGAAFALANVASERERLTEGEPALPCKPAFDYGSPEDQDVDSAVLSISRRVFRHRELRLRRGCSPGLDLGHTAGLKLGDDLIGDFVIEARPILAGA